MTKGMALFLAIFIIVCSLAVFGIKSIDENYQNKVARESANCTLGLDNNRRTVAIQHVAKREKILAAFESCLKSNNNRDVVYNDTNELSKSCGKISYTVNGLESPDAMDDVEKSRMIQTIANVEACGGK